MAVLKIKVNGKWIAVSGGGRGGYADVSAAFAKQTEYKDPMEYLRSLDDGKWKIVYSGMLYYMDKVSVPEGMVVRHEVVLSDDTFIYENVWVGDRLEYSRDSERGTITFAGETLATESFVNKTVGSPAADKAGSVPVVSAAGNLELKMVLDGEEVVS